MKRVLAIALAVALPSAWLVGCASNTPLNIHELRTFAPVQQPRAILLTEAIAGLQISTSWVTVDTENGLLPGKYVGIYENSSGTLFYGEGPICYMKAQGVHSPQFGGIWVPASGEKPQMFIVLDRPGSQAATYNPYPSGPPSMEHAVGAAIGVAVVGMLEGPQEEKVMIFSPDTAFSEKLSAVVNDQLK